MRRTRKTLMIVGGLLVAAAGSGYVMLLRDDHRAIAEAGIGDAAAPAAAVPAANGDHTAQGTIAPPAAVAVPSTHVDDAVPQRAAVPPPAAAPARTNAAPPSTAVVPVIAGQAPPAKPTAPPPTVHVVTVEPEDSTPAKAKPAPATQAPVQAAQPTQAAQPVQSAPPPVQAAQASRSSQPAYQPAQRAERKRDGLERHAAAPSGTKSETPETAALVHESAKLDPSLPPPQYVATPSADRARPSAGGNAVAAAMTEQLVRQSSSFKAPASASAAPAAAQ
ncbi:extensin [Burkholderia ambifaria]|uniref:extensin n=1 Tax=Burkholderia ambifaria TaxID=152480 RepID=UPI00158A6BC1|nr:extensin [Burkholderia ambifaria]WDR86470.1 extensin [Burkholderia ambifaria]WDR99123.1 extensin [Burkholderia ambifaria]